MDKRGFIQHTYKVYSHNHDGTLRLLEESPTPRAHIRFSFYHAQVDGPTHYSYASHVTLGHTQLKRRHLAALGYTLCTVPYWRWYHGKSR